MGLQIWIAKVACRSPEYIRQYIRLVENGEERLIQGVEQGIFPISFAVLVAQSDEGGIQNVLMDAFDRGIVNCENFARARSIIKSRLDQQKRKGNHRGVNGYSVATLTNDIASPTTRAKNSYVREVQGKKAGYFCCSMALPSFGKMPFSKIYWYGRNLVNVPNSWVL